MRKLSIAIFCAFLNSCGVQEEGAQVSFQFPFQDAITNCDWANLTGLKATLLISGHMDQPCELAVSSSNYTAEGVCENIVKGSERYLLLAYHLPADAGIGGPAADVGYMISYVDLSDGAVAPGAVNVEHQLSNNGVTAELINTTSGVNDLPQEGVNVISDDPLDRARAWARELILERQKTSTPLDVDGDACPNLHEVCLGTYAALDTTDADACGLSSSSASSVTQCLGSSHSVINSMAKGSVTRSKLWHGH